MKDWQKALIASLGKLAPSIAAGIGGPIPAVVGAAVQVIADRLGDPAAQPEDLPAMIAGATPEQIAAIRAADNDFKVRMAQVGIDTERLALENAGQVNATMIAEAQSDHWPTYSWRPAIGFAVALNVGVTSLTVAVSYAGVILFARDSAPLSYIPAMVGAMAGLLVPVAPILGIAAWFRGKMQADPSVPTDNRG